MPTINRQTRQRFTSRPLGIPAGFQRWSDLLLLHWAVEPKSIQTLLPPGLSVDTYGGKAWIGLIPFYMSHVRPRRWPSLPWLSFFCETNLRTYVHHDGDHPGIWFFSLDAARLIPVWIARGMWHLNYHWASMEMDRDGNRVRYQSHRHRDPESGRLQLEAELGNALENPPNLEGGVVSDTRQLPGEDVTLEYFLAERYLMYACHSSGSLYRGQVYHSPYPIRGAKLTHCDQTLTATAGIELADLNRPEHVLYSEGVETTVFPIEKIVGG